MSPYYMWYSTNYIYFAFTLSFQFLFQFCIPALIMVKCNVSLYQQLRNVQKSNNLTASTNESIRKSVFRAKFTLSITAIFIIGSMITWLPSLPNDLIHWKPEQFQELESETSIFVVIGVLVYVINCSGNYFVYKYLKWKETKVKKPKYLNSMWIWPKARINPTFHQRFESYFPHFFDNFPRLWSWGRKIINTYILNIDWHKLIHSIQNWPLHALQIRKELLQFSKEEEEEKKF